MNTKHSDTISIQTICQSFKLWQEYIDPSGMNSKAAFDAMPMQDRIDIAETLFWYESDNEFGNFEE
jgi:hypothetical protein